jgi:hypothetical protein
MKQIITNIYPITELTDQQINKAYDKYIEDLAFIDDFIKDNIKNIAKTIGIQIDDIYYSGFCSQGDGAMFTGTYQYNPNWENDLKAYAPNQTVVHHIAKNLEYVNDRKDLIATITHTNSRYYHENTADITITVDDMDINPSYSLYLKDFMKWMYDHLETEYEYQMSLDAFKETALANDYHFDIDGNLKG